MTNKEDIIHYLKEITADKIDELNHDANLEETTKEFIIKSINYFAFYLQSFCELPSIDENIINKFAHIIIPKFIKLILPTQDVDLYTQSLLNIGSICYFLIKEKKEICFFQSLTDLILQYKNYIPKNRSNFIQIEGFLQYYQDKSVFNYISNNDNNNNLVKEEIFNERSIQFRPNKKFHPINSTISNALYISGIFIEIRKYISDITFFDNDKSGDDCFAKSLFILSFLRACYPFMSNEYINFFTSDLKDRLQQLDINFSSPKSIYLDKFKCENSLVYSRTLREIADLSDDNSDFFNELYFTTINNLIKSNIEANYNIVIAELITFPSLPFYTKSFIQNLADSFMNDLIYSIKENDSHVIISISNILNLKEKLPPPKELFEKCTGNNLFYSSFYPYIQNYFTNSSIDELFDSEYHEDQGTQNASISESTGKLIVRLLESGKYNKSTKLKQIFICLFNLYLKQLLTDDIFILFSKKDDFKEPMFQALSSVIPKDANIDNFQFDLFFICEVLYNLNSTLNFRDNPKYNEFPFALISESLVYKLDSILIPQYFNAYNFLPISDIELFWDLSVHSLLFYKLIQPNCVEIKDILLNCDDFSIGLSYCLYSIFEKLNDIRILCKAAIIAYSLNDSTGASITTEEPDENENIKKNDILFELIKKMKLSFNNTIKDATTFAYLIEALENTNEEYIDNLDQFLSEVDLTANIDPNSNFSEILSSNNISILDSNNDDKAAIIITILMITNNNKIEEIVNDSVVSELFDSSSILAKTVISKYISTRKINEDVITEDTIQSTFLINSQLGNINICKNLINLVDISQNDDFVYSSSPEIIKMIFKEKIPFQSVPYNFLSLLNNCETYQQYETAFLCLLNREPQSENLSPVLVKVILSNELPSCLRNDKIIHHLMKRISENPVQFLQYISTSNRIEYSQFQPFTEKLFLHVLSQFTDFIFDLLNYKDSSKTDGQDNQQYYCQELAYLLANLRYTSFSKISSKDFTINGLEDLYDYIPASLLKHFMIKYVKNNRMIEDTCLLLDAEKSISYSLSKMMIKDTILDYSQVMFIQFEQPKLASEVIIDETIDIFDYSVKEVRKTYKLSSIISQKNNVYIYDANHLNDKLEKDPGYVCYTPAKSYFTKNILEQIKYVVYQQESNNDEYALWLSSINQSKRQNVSQLSGNQFLSSIVYDMGCVFMEVLNNPHIDWKSFKENSSNFNDIAIASVYQLYIKPLFDTFCDDPEFSYHLFTQRYNILFDMNFTDTFSEEIIRAAKAFPNKGLLMCILCDDVMNMNQSIYFTLLQSVEFQVDAKVYAISQMQSMYNELYFQIFFKQFIESNELTKEELKELIKTNKGLSTVIFNISDPSYIDLLGENISIDLINEGIDHAVPSFLSELLKRTPDDPQLPEKIRILASKLYNNQQYQTLVLQKIKEQKENEKLLTISSISSLLLSTNGEFREAIIKEMVSQYPPEKAANYNIPNIIVNLLDVTKRFEDYYPLVEIYRTAFLGNQGITSMFINFLFSNRPSNVRDYEKMANLTLRLSQISFDKFRLAMRNNFPRSQNDFYHVMVNYSSSDYEQVYDLFFKFCGKCKFLKLFMRSEFKLEVLFQACYSSLSNKKDFIKLFEPLFYENMDTSYIALLLIYMNPYPRLFAHYFEKLISYKSVKETYSFTIFVHFVSRLIYHYYERKLFYTNEDNVDSLITKILQITNDFIETNIMQINYNPRIEGTADYLNIIENVDILLDSIKILQHDARIELFRFYRNIAFTIPNAIIKIMVLFGQYTQNLYNFLQEETERLALSHLSCEIFRESIGNRQIVPCEGSFGYNLAISFINNQFNKCLACNSLSYKTISPYLQLLKAILKLDLMNPLKRTIAYTLTQNQLIYNLFTNITISTKVLALETNDNGETVASSEEFSELQDFFLYLINSVKSPEYPNYTILNSNMIAISMKKLKKEDELFNYRILLFDFVIRKLPEDLIKDIAHQTYQFVHDLDAELIDKNETLHNLLDLFNQYPKE